MGLSIKWFCYRLFLPESSLGVHRMHDRDADRRSPRNRSFLGDRYSASPHYGSAPYIRHYHDGGDLLWSDVRWVDDGNSGQYPGRGLFCSNGHGWLCNGQAGPCRPGSGHCSHLLLCRRDTRYCRPHFLCAGSGQLCSCLRSSGIFLPSCSWG